MANGYCLGSREPPTLLASLLTEWRRLFKKWWHYLCKSSHAFKNCSREVGFRGCEAKPLQMLPLWNISRVWLWVKSFASAQRVAYAEPHISHIVFVCLLNSPLKYDLQYFASTGGHLHFITNLYIHVCNYIFPFSVKRPSKMAYIFNMPISWNPVLENMMGRCCFYLTGKQTQWHFWFLDIWRSYCGSW